MAANKETKGYREPLVRALGDGNWHSFPELFYATEGVISPDDAVRALGTWKTEMPEDIETRIRMGKEAIVVSALSALRCEQQGFRGERATRKYRLDPARMKEMSGARVGSRVAFRALLAIPELRMAFETVATDDKNNDREGLNPAQRYWVNFALEPEGTDAQPYNEEA